MGYLFFDESIHTRGDFILGAWVYCESDPAPAVDAALLASGLRPGIDEFKSGDRMADQPSFQKLRESLWDALFGSPNRVGLVVIPSKARPRLGVEALVALKKFVTANGLASESLSAFMDEGLFTSVERAEREALALGLFPRVAIRVEQDSRTVPGLQLADMVAHASSTLLLARMGLVTKTVKARPMSGFSPNEDLELAYTLRAGLRFTFFHRPKPEFDPGTRPDSWVEVADYGLHLSDDVPDDLRGAVIECFGRAWHGCIR